VNFEDCVCLKVNWAKRNFGLMFLLIFGVIGLIVFFAMKIHKIINIVEGNNLKILDISNLVFKIKVFGNNTLNSPFEIIETFNTLFIKVVF
jgi:hypothetical protein